MNGEFLDMLLTRKSYINVQTLVCVASKQQVHVVRLLKLRLIYLKRDYT